MAAAPCCVAVALLLAAIPAATAAAAAPKGLFSCPMMVGDVETVALGQELADRPKNAVVAVRPKHTPCGGFLSDRTYYVRARTTDAAVLRMVIDKHEFEHLDSLFGGATPQRVLDLGANAGLAAAYFAQRWPGAQVAALEPSSDNFRMAVLNNLDNKDVRVFWGGIWDKPARLAIRPQDKDDKSKGWGEWGFVVEELSDARLAELRAADIIPAYTIEGIMASMGWDFIDYAKVDVECTEFQLFANTSRVARPWLSHIGCLSMELHKWCGTPPELVTSGLRDAGFEFKGRFGELNFWCRRPEDVAAGAASQRPHGGAPAAATPLARANATCLAMLGLMAALFVVTFRSVLARLLGFGPPLRGQGLLLKHHRLTALPQQHSDAVIKAGQL